MNRKRWLLLPVALLTACECERKMVVIPEGHVANQYRTMEDCLRDYKPDQCHEPEEGGGTWLGPSYKPHTGYVPSSHVFMIINSGNYTAPRTQFSRTPGGGAQPLGEISSFAAGRAAPGVSVGRAGGIARGGFGASAAGHGAAGSGS